MKKHVSKLKNKKSKVAVLTIENCNRFCWHPIPIGEVDPEAIVILPAQPQP